MEASEWDEPPDGDAPAVYPPAPLPLHERTWRHPSELGLREPFVIPPTPARRVNRGLLVAAGVAGVACAVGLALLMATSGSGTPAARTAAPTLAAVAKDSLTTVAMPVAGIAWLGMRTASTAGHGAQVEWLADDSPLARAGVRVGDVIVMIDDDRLTDAAQLARHLAGRAPGTRIHLIVERDAERHEYDVVLTSAP